MENILNEINNFGVSLSEWSLLQLRKQLDPKESGTCTFENFQNVIPKLLSGQFSQLSEQDFSHLEQLNSNDLDVLQNTFSKYFRQYGRVCRANIGDILSDLGFGFLSSEECQEMSLFFPEEEGQISLNDFMTTMNKTMPLLSQYASAHVEEAENEGEQIVETEKNARPVISEEMEEASKQRDKSQILQRQLSTAEELNLGLSNEINQLKSEISLLRKEVEKAKQLESSLLLSNDKFQQQSQALLSSQQVASKLSTMCDNLKSEKAKLACKTISFLL